MKPHKHAELIKAWADGAEIQCKTPYGWATWEYEQSPSWFDVDEYRIKPEPKPDVNFNFRVASKFYQPDSAGGIVMDYANKPNLKLTFDGETGDLKNSEVLK